MNTDDQLNKKCIRVHSLVVALFHAVYLLVKASVAMLFISAYFSLLLLEIKQCSNKKAIAKLFKHKYSINYILSIYFLFNFNGSSFVTGPQIAIDNE